MASPAAGSEVDPRYPEFTVSDVAVDDEKQEQVAPHAEQIPWSQDRTRETARGRIAFALLAILGFIIAGAFVTLWTGWGADGDVDDLLTLIFAPVIGLVGAVTGFYFGEKSATNAAEAAVEAVSAPSHASRRPSTNR